MALTEAQKRQLNRNRSYWKKREEENRRRNIAEEAGYEAEIAKIYANMVDEIEKQIYGFFSRYARNEGLTIDEAKRRVSRLDIDAYARKAEKYVAEKTFTARANEEMRLYNLTMKVNRLEMLKAELGLEMCDGFSKLETYMGEKLEKLCGAITTLSESFRVRD